jgi:NAD(P)-dependent dehydrogenase (short-subunit alcohol dehydrogenase family)
LNAPTFTGQVAIVTGAGSGLGAAVAKALAAGGAHCVLAGRRPAALAEVQAAIRAAGGQSTALPTDVTQVEPVERLAQAALAVAGRIDILVNGAGIFRLAPFEETSLELFDATIAVNLRGAFLCCRAVWPHMRRAGGGQIVNLSSMAAVRAFEGNTAYAPSKAGLNGLGGVMALEGQPFNIRVLTICPAATNTPLWAGQAPAAVRAQMMPPEAIGAQVAWLLATPRSLAFEPILIGNFNDPWQAA